jgi:sec-independent protein translocase protein TatA
MKEDSFAILGPPMGIGLENPVHLAMLALVVLLVFGPKRLPEMGRSLGRGIREFTNSLTSDVEADEQPGRAADGRQLRE